MAQETLTERLTKGKGQKQKGGGTKKHGRNKAKCLYYRTNRSLKNKLAKNKKHRSNHPNDQCALDAYKRLLTIV